MTAIVKKSKSIIYKFSILRKLTDRAVREGTPHGGEAIVRPKKKKRKAGVGTISTTKPMDLNVMSVERRPAALKFLYRIHRRAF